ncbi:hypothetical protein ABVT39_001380 [Epinephelus coioides]
MEEWGIKGKVRCLVTDAASNMIACARALQVRHSICVTHSLNLIVQKSFDQVPILNDIRAKSRKIVTYFRTSTTAKDRLSHMQDSMGRSKHILQIEVETWWNSTLVMLQHLYEQCEAVGAALTSLSTDLRPLTSREYDIIGETVKVLGPFHQATVELSEEKRVSASKTIPLMKMLRHTVQCEASHLDTDPAKLLAESLIRRLREHLAGLETMSVTTLATLLDPRFKVLGFYSQLKANKAVKRLWMECANVVTSRKTKSSGPSETKLFAQRSISSFHPSSASNRLNWTRAQRSVMIWNRSSRESWLQERRAGRGDRRRWRSFGWKKRMP